jgi:hypothetical protein
MERRKNWSRVQDGGLIPGETGRLTVGCKITWIMSRIVIDMFLELAAFTIWGWIFTWDADILDKPQYKGFECTMKMEPCKTFVQIARGDCVWVLIKPRQAFAVTKRYCDKCDGRGEDRDGGRRTEDGTLTQLCIAAKQRTIWYTRLQRYYTSSYWVLKQGKIERLASSEERAHILWIN